MKVLANTPVKFTAGASIYFPDYNLSTFLMTVRVDYKSTTKRYVR